MLSEKNAKKFIQSTYKKLYSFFHEESKQVTQLIAHREIDDSDPGKYLPIDKGKEYLSALRKSLYTYQFSRHPFYDYIEVGINHIVIYPHPTQAGRKLLACMVATMWDTRNYPYFNVYKGLFETDTEGGVEFILDHSGNKYSNPVFNSPLNSAAEHAHFHPIQSGGYHTHYSYGWHFAGLMAVHSILALGEIFLEEGESKEVLKQETINFLDQFSRYVATVLLGTLPFDKLQNEKEMQDLQVVLNSIYKHGIFNLYKSSDLLELAKNIQISKQTIQLIRKNYTVVKQDDPLTILTTFIYDLNHFANNVKQMIAAEFNSPVKLYRFGDQESIEQLFKLACCLRRPDTSIEYLDYQALQVRYEILKEKAEAQGPHMLTKYEQTELEFISKEFNIRQLRQKANLDKKEQLRQLRTEFEHLLSAFNKEKSIDYSKIDEELVGFRERVAARFCAKGLAFTCKEIKEDEEQVKIVNRPSTHTALAEINKGFKRSPRDQIAAQIFLQSVLYFSAQGIKQDELYPSLWPVIYEVITYHASLLGIPLLTTHTIYGVLEPKSMISFADMLPTIATGQTNESDITYIEDSLVPEVKINAHWSSVTEKQSTSGANHCKLDIFTILDDIEVLNFPIVNAQAISKELLAAYGVSLHVLSEKLYYQDNVTLHAAEYEFNENYLKNYVLEEKLGGGLPIHMHKFTHYLVPMEPSCQGGLILGRQIGIDKWSFIAIKLPYGYVLQIEPNVIHSDALCQGRYTIALTSVKEVQTALLRKKDGSIQLINQYPAEVNQNPITKLI
ncbi:hypothetical protein ACQUW5_04260 [Legionella sp. CNM-1927-20]|uniref:hypothetical protein n=1 Tax=Legionella sp. CNM-1927-20 TaxID=3422221 RepID=UPI00403AA308